MKVGLYLATVYTGNRCRSGVSAPPGAGAGGASERICLGMGGAPSPGVAGADAATDAASGAAASRSRRDADRTQCDDPAAAQSRPHGRRKRHHGPAIGRQLCAWRWPGVSQRRVRIVWHLA